MPETMSFLPEDYLERKVQRRTNVICLSLFAVVMTAVVAAFFVTDRQRAEVLGLQASVNQQFEEAAKRLEQLEKLEQQRERMIRKASVTATLLERVPKSVVLAELVNHMPPSLSLLELNMEMRTVQPKVSQATTALEAAKKEKTKKNNALTQIDVEPPPTEVTLQLVGIAPTDIQIAQFMTALSQRPLFGDLNLAFSEQMEIEDTTMRKFRVDVRLNSDIDPQKVEPLLVKRNLKHDPMSDNGPVIKDGKVTEKPKTPGDTRPGNHSIPGLPAANRRYSASSQD